MEKKYVLKLKTIEAIAAPITPSDNSSPIKYMTKTPPSTAGPKTKNFSDTFDPYPSNPNSP